MKESAPDSFPEGPDKEATPLRGSFALFVALVCALTFGAASWWSWRAGSLLDPFAPPKSVSIWDWATSPLEWNAFQRLPVVTGDVNGAFAVGQHVWVVGAAGLILHSPDGGRTWESQETIAWAPKNMPAPTAAAPPSADAAESFGIVRSAYAGEPRDPSDAVWQKTPDENREPADI